MKSQHIRSLRLGLVGLVLVVAVSDGRGLRAQTVAQEETVRSVRRKLERLPYYGVFDYMVFRVNGGLVGLAGYAFQGSLKKDAEMAAKQATGVTEVLCYGTAVIVEPTDSSYRG